MYASDTHADYRDLYDLIQAFTGINLSDHQREDVDRTAKGLLSASDLNGVQDLLLRLSCESIEHPLWQRLIGIVTVGETYFFRNQYQFNALRDDILPLLIRRRRDAGTLFLRFWSAGCAAGEEPYSLAILLRELLPDIDQWSISILGTDINLASLERARSARYRTWSFRTETPDYLSARWFRSDADAYELSGTIRRMVTFAPLNLVSDAYPSFENGTADLDLILCRNVTIYFDQSTTREIVTRFHQALNDDAWLVVGHAEPMAAIYHDFFVPHNFEGTVMYQKYRAEVNGSNPVLPLLPDISWHSMPSLPVPVPPMQQPGPIRSAMPETMSQADEQPDLVQQARRAANEESWDEALKLLMLAESANRLHPEVHYLRAMVLLHTDEIDRAIASLRRAVYCDPDFALAHFTLAGLYQDRNDPKESARHLRLARNVLANLEPHRPLPHCEDLSAGMLRALIDHQFPSR